MGIHDRGTVRGRSWEWRWRLAAGASLILFLLSPLRLAMGARAAEGHQEYRCTPDVKYECSMERCEKTTHGFQGVESFIYDARTRKISACLWTNCYSGAATLFKDAASGTTTAIARLKPAAHPGNEPLIVSLTLDDAGPAGRGDAAKKDETHKMGESHFTAVWGYGSKRLTFDMGRCAVRDVR